MNKQNWIKQK